jgi:transcription elongation GreA/GreB family factor
MNNIKTVVINKIIEEVEAQVQNAERGRLDAIAESKSHKGAMASRYDTFKEEAQYLAGGHNAQRIKLTKILDMLISIRNNPQIITKGSIYAIVEVSDLDDGSISKYFILPAGGGNTYDVDKEEITAINVGAPMARAFIGTVAGDKVEIKIQGTTKQFRVVSVT